MQGSLGRLVFVSAMGGLSTTSILAAINAGAQAADKGSVSYWGAGLFIIALLLFIQAQHYILITTTAEIGAIIHKMRVRLMDYVRRSELLPLETIGRARNRRRHHDGDRNTDASQQYAGVRRARWPADRAGHGLRRLSVVLGFRARRRHRRRRRRDVPLQDQAACGATCAKRRCGRTGCTIA